MDEVRDQGNVASQQLFDDGRGLVSASQPDDLGWWTAECRHIGEIRVERNDREPVATGSGPKRCVVSPRESEPRRLLRIRKNISERTAQPKAQVLIEQQPHAAVTARLSRSAA